ncbi:MAG: hypothetical protein KZQ64_07255 [gamma proteobacterium symbiont of Bathyaustriella thionipta]|nr:hypothetical protein [gamma proteobacterium symbiont of Bathyaustriella thionipta]MCU7950495.1 hypothetical protein [gamma proteobacterium symbiont of Bathyaustriella thionipta]MCU7953170.1 hypothetical protein [gamma proteobacterium symbiont of Bathyaustriella thionipta]MCU7956989.1 hypothetical protein [gamma proteobacterium symbiont of Bathyaustriella thionipta]MCU7968283.1 hypothetical protein [gamma proteobacterium symbiont of Bathyaustriella thionipta]
MSKKSVFLSIFFLMLPVTGFTLGFGNLTVFSKLNEPLKIHINLVGSKSVSIDDIIVKNADLNTYRRAKLPKPSAFNKVQFKTIKEADGSVVVELSTRKPVREPFFTFIIDMKWRTGHLNREYTFLLDPPEFIHKNSFPAKKRKSITKKASPIKDVAAKPFRKPSRKISQPKVDYNAVIAAHINGDTYGPTKRADTLWEIAKKVKPDNKVTTHQTMQALFALNPDAFIRGNINLLKQGKTLKIPTSNEVRQINGKPLLKNAPVSSVKTTSSSSATTKQVENNQTIQPPSEKKSVVAPVNLKNNEDQAQAQLKILLPAEELLSNPVTSTEDLLLINKALQTSITTIKSLQSENEDLGKKIASLTDKLNNLDKHNQNLNNKISEITALLKKNNETNTTTAKSINSSAQTGSDEIASNPTKVDSPDTPIEIQSEVAPIIKKESFVRDLLSRPVITFSLAFFTIIILVSVLFSIRNHSKKRKNYRQETKAASKNHNEINTPTTPQRYVEQPKPAVTNTIQETSPTSLQGTDISEDKDKDEDDMDFFEYFEKKINAPEETVISKNLEGLPASQSEDKEQTEAPDDITFDISQEDVEEYEKNATHLDNHSRSTILSEIDTYLAYGNYNEAEKLLFKQLKISPSDKNLHLKLFECYTFSNKRYEFIKHVENIGNLLNTDMVLRHRIENIFQQTWNETLDINSF